MNLSTPPSTCKFKKPSILSTTEPPVQIPLIHIVESDDLHLAEQSDIVWFELLRHLDWKQFRPIAIEYYESLWHFNQEQAREREQRVAPTDAFKPETEIQASFRLVMERATMGAPTSIIELPPQQAPGPVHVDPADIRPGHVPFRIAGRAPKCFFAMFKAFIGMAVRGRVPEPEEVSDELLSNPGYARTCGFTLPNLRQGYRQSDIPGLRKLQQFDQIMTQNGLWQKAAKGQVADNLKKGRLRPDDTVVHDTTHYPAFSSMRTVEVPVREVAPKDEGTIKQPKRKSHPKNTKNCRCKDRANCSHPWVSADSGAGTVVKSGGQMHWAHKASTLSFSQPEILLDAVAMSDAASHDSNSLVPHIERIRKLYPALQITRVLDDSAADDPELKNKLKLDFNIELLVSPNPRGRKPIKKDLPRGIDHISSAATPVCSQGFPFDFLGCRHDSSYFLFRAPLNEQGKPVCEGCPKKLVCCRAASLVRQIAVPFQRLPWIDPEFPQISRRFRRAIARRTVIERIHKLMKYDYGDERLTKRGNKAFQARLDKTLLAMHLVVASP